MCEPILQLCSRTLVGLNHIMDEICVTGYPVLRRPGEIFIHGYLRPNVSWYNLFHRLPPSYGPLRLFVVFQVTQVFCCNLYPGLPPS